MDSFHSEKPLLAYNAQCPFCRFWVKKWHKLTGDRVKYESLQEVSKYNHSISETALLHKIHAFTPEGKIFSGAKAVYYILSFNPGYSWMYELYGKLKLFKYFSEAAYRLVSAHRHTLFIIMKLFGARN